MTPRVWARLSKNVEISDDVFKQTEAIINSMTPLEREKPEIIDAKRRERLAKGSGTTMAEVNKLMKQFEDTRKMMKASSQNIVLADSSKFGQRGFGRICALEDIDVIITDDRISEQMVAIVEGAGVDLIIVK